jgi:GABA permease
VKREYGGIWLIVVLLGAIFLVMAAATDGIGAWFVAGLVILVAALLLAGRTIRGSQHPPESQAPAVAPVDDGVHRVLLVADAAAGSPEVREAVLAGAGGRSTEVLVIAPALGSRVARWTGDEAAYAGADDRLQATLRAFEETGIDASGHTGSHDPIQAADEALREFPADEILFATDGAGGENWLEDDLVERARSRYDVPVTHVPVAPR